MAHKELTKAEEQVMQFIWKLERCFLKDVVENFSQPRPAYTTVSTVIRVLVRKKFVGYKTYGKINEYYPLISKADYFNRKLKPIIANYFNGSTTSLASYFANAQLNLSELEEVKALINEKIKKLKAK
ncbi:MAG: BlaI/MecI/CopY family transcriptional regulator [Cyclobacteriaceae bacterium]